MVVHTRYLSHIVHDSDKVDSIKAAAIITDGYHIVNDEVYELVKRMTNFNETVVFAETDANKIFKHMDVVSLKCMESFSFIDSPVVFKWFEIEGGRYIMSVEQLWRSKSAIKEKFRQWVVGPETKKRKVR